MNKALLLLTLFLFLMINTGFAQTSWTWTGDGNDGDWSNSTNWTDGTNQGMPGINDEAIIQKDATITSATGTPQISRLVVRGGQARLITLNINLNINGKGWTDSNMEAVQVSAGQLTFGAGFTFNVEAPTGADGILTANANAKIINNGNITVTGGETGINISSSGIMTNNGTINIENNNDSGMDITAGTFLNEGEINHSNTTKFLINFPSNDETRTFTNAVCGSIISNRRISMRGTNCTLVNNGYLKCLTTFTNTVPNAATNNGFYDFGNGSWGDGGDDNGLKVKENPVFSTCSDIGIDAAYVWYDDAIQSNQIGSNDTAGVFTYTGTATGTVTLYSCFGDVFTATVTIPDDAPMVADTAYCKDATASALSATGTALLWYTTATGGTGDTLAPTPSTGTAGTTDYYVVQTLNTCESPRAKITVTINETAAPMVADTAYCKDAPASALSATGTSLLWYTAATGGTGDATAPTPSTGTAGTTDYYVTQTLNTCESERAKITVTINEPAAPTVADIAYCKDATASALSATGTALLWYTMATGGTVDTTAPTPSTTTAGMEEFWVSQTVNTCESPRAKITVTVATCDCGEENELEVTGILGQILAGEYIADVRVYSSTKVAENASVTFKAGTEIVLYPGFEVPSNSTFHAYIATCQSALLPTPTTAKQINANNLAANEVQPINVKISPNPFRDKAIIEFYLPQEEVVSIRVFDQGGRILDQVMSGEKLTKGQYQVSLNSDQLYGGLFYVTLQTAKENIVKKIMIIK